MLGLKLLLPLYLAVIELLPTPRSDVLKVAVVPLRIPVPSEVEPLKNSTSPVRVPAPGDVILTVAVSVTDCPNTEGLGEEVNAVAVSALFTT